MKKWGICSAESWEARLRMNRIRRNEDAKGTQSSQRKSKGRKNAEAKEQNGVETERGVQVLERGEPDEDTEKKEMKASDMIYD